MKFSGLSQSCKGKMPQLPLDIQIQGLAFDSRQISIRSGVVFFAISGQNHDGHQFINDAYEKGVRLFVVEKEIKLKADASYFLVEDAIVAMQELVKTHRSAFNYPVIGITGSNGKTIVKEWLAQMLDDQFDIVKSPKSFNSQLGVPLSVWAMGDHHNLGIFEAGISEVEEMQRLEQVIQPTLGIFTNIGEAHNAGFKDLTEKAKEKAKLFSNCQKVVYCAKHELVGKALAETVSGSTQLIPWKVTEQKGKKYVLDVLNNSLTFYLKYDDPASVENILHCAAMLVALGYDQEFIQLRLNRLSSIKMRLEMKQAINRSYVIDDTYNNDLYGLEVALDFLARQNQRSKKTVILSDLYQTGLSSDALYQRVSELLQKHNIQKFVGVGKEINQSSSKFHIPSKFYQTTEEFLAAGYTPNDEIVLVKGARDFEFELIVNSMEQKAHGTILEVNLENLIHNLNYYRSKLEPETKIMVMVKALAYGGGNFEIANLLQFHKVDYLGVAYADEAVELRKNGIHIPIMIMNVSPTSFRLLKEYNLEPEIYSLDQLIDFLDYYENMQDLPSIHIKLETGMNRLGFTENNLQRLIEQLKLNKHLKVKSIFSHLAGSEDPRHADYTKQQGERFERMSQAIMESLWYTPMRHLVNTGGIANYPSLHFDMARLGIGLHGFDPTQTEQGKLKIVSTLKCNVSQVKKIAAGESIGYGRSGFAKSDTMIAIIPIGYADGYLRAFGNGTGQMLINDQLVPTIGNVCMDMTMVDVTGLDVKSGDEVVVFGEKPNISELAEWIKTIPYEILTNVSQRVKRVFLSE
ncbi:MAG: bifunctional UDP-N-acetylmuramoyl-tripeptide:D-alanyl-D-alanine ligase/alanine racemase [Reichenbachiella sp.]|uniref:bifunctional UDP-N-acetylmuramoyl-tripeptide:D-alanyl-D-alanine ligase/alanine racemase n=1 Tax=Reichenbachiella sp. TaxID=2184521 RepID=UPI0029676E32|nr:bifunctional UDP-N-acetylmuramoyl-tripeptide:D-alanyl-D-alanine ligase/alanine racemase [Reichenbachiella sp.]MDW3212083.1 bifunctional UDP-N-acetylmuramoyl-tripeptide:D-alanyl-D-alanine ligase/alanine racemase [Reichenbachiella sp.]